MKPAKPKAAEKDAANDWRAQTLAEVRRLIHAADPEIVEERKWIKPTKPAGVPVFSRGGIVCTGETYKEAVKLTFAHGAKLDDPAELFNAGLDGNVRRAIDLHEGDALDAKAFKALVRAAVALNLSVDKPKPAAKAKAKAPPADKVVLLSGGNPQIAKADGDEPVQRFIAALPGWKHDVGRRLDDLIVRTVPNVRKAVRWNTPFYGLEGEGWFLGFHCMTKYVKVAFFNGSSLKPLPPGESKQKAVRYLDIYENAPFDEAQLVNWIKQASELPGEHMF